MMNNSTNLFDEDHSAIYPILLPVLFIGICIGAINIFAIVIIIRSKCLCRAANFPIISILFGATIQGAITTPTYVFKRLDESIWHIEPNMWLCDFYRLPYFLCGHSLKVSLMLVSFDRLAAIKFPYRYNTLATKKRSIIVTSLSWIFVLLVDMVPFLPFGKEPDDEGCTYIPKKEWGITVITLFNIIPFTTIAINYLIIWRAAAKITFSQYDQHQSLWSNSTANSSAEDLQNDLLNINEQIKLPKPDILKTISDSKSKDNRKSQISFDISTDDVQEIEIRKNRRLDQKISIEMIKDKVMTSPLMTSRKASMLRLALEMKATKTSFTLLIVYLLCWGPLGIFYLLDHYCSSCISKNEDHSTDRFIVKVVSFSSSIFLPLIYCWKTKDFRTEICRFTCKERYQKKQNRAYYKDTTNLPEIRLLKMKT